MVMCHCCGVGCVGNADRSDMMLCAIALWDWGLPRQFGITPADYATCIHQEHCIEIELQQLLIDPKFTAYGKVFKTFGFGLRLEAIILSILTERVLEVGMSLSLNAKAF